VRRLLDTDTCIELLRGNTQVIEKAREYSPSDLGVSVITRHELMYGVMLCSRKRKNTEREKVQRLLSTVHEIPFAGSCADRAADIRVALGKIGCPIGPYDLLIAATALDESCELVTHNLSEFSRIPDLTCVSWNIS
jgi:tRNA(fMet)-specific endonuclease VapC